MRASTSEMYGLARESSCQRLDIRGITYNVRCWGPADAPPLVLLHGTQDSSVTFQFLIDALAMDWSVVAPDWRGHGLTDHERDGYWFHDFVADLDVLLSHLYPDSSVPLVGHSLGGNIASIYSGLRPDRVSHLVSLDGFGPLVSRIPVDFPAIMDRYLEKTSNKRTPRAYASIDEMAARLMKTNRRLSEEKAIFLATHSARRLDDGNYVWLFDPNHRFTIPSLHTMDEWSEIWGEIRAPSLWLSSEDERKDAPLNHPEVFDARAKMIRGLTHHKILDTGHNLHHDQPEQVVRSIEAFLKKG